MTAPTKNSIYYKITTIVPDNTLIKEAENSDIRRIIFTGKPTENDNIIFTYEMSNNYGFVIENSEEKIICPIKSGIEYAMSKIREYINTNLFSDKCDDMKMIAQVFFDISVIDNSPLAVAIHGAGNFISDEQFIIKPKVTIAGKYTIDFDSWKIKTTSLTFKKIEKYITSISADLYTTILWTSPTKE